MKKILILITVITCISLNSLAQKFTSIEYTIGLPMANLKDYIEPASFRGATLNFRNMVTPNISAGFSLGWSVFYERVNTPYTDGSLTLSGIQYRYTNSVPVLITGDYFFSTEGFKPFVGLGIGTIWSERYTEIGLYGLTTDTWHFALSPEAGFMYDIKPGIGLLVSARYNNAFKTDALESQSYLALNVGFAFTRGF